MQEYNNPLDKWTVDSYPVPMVWQIKRTYPDKPEVSMYEWVEIALGKEIRRNKLERISKVCLIMMSPQCVDWLNMVSHWLEINEGSLV